MPCSVKINTSFSPVVVLTATTSSPSKSFIAMRLDCRESYSRKAVFLTTPLRVTITRYRDVS